MLDRGIPLSGEGVEISFLLDKLVIVIVDDDEDDGGGSLLFL